MQRKHNLKYKYPLFLRQAANIYNKFNYCRDFKVLTQQIYFTPLTILMTGNEVPC
jgi:hypothetical protein